MFVLYRLRLNLTLDLISRDDQSQRYSWTRSCLIQSQTYFQVFRKYLIWRRTSSHHGILFRSCCTFSTFWRHMTKFSTCWHTFFLTSWHTFWLNDVFLHYDVHHVMTYYFMLFCIFMTSWHTSWHHDVLFDACKILFDVLTYLLTSWLILHNL